MIDDTLTHTSIDWVWPLSSNSDHQDYSIFSRESRTKPLFATGILGRGHTQHINIRRMIVDAPARSGKTTNLHIP